MRKPLPPKNANETQETEKGALPRGEKGAGGDS
jgi:hypothetical protein